MVSRSKPRSRIVEGEEVEEKEEEETEEKECFAWTLFLRLARVFTDSRLYAYTDYQNTYILYIHRRQSYCVRS